MATRCAGLVLALVTWLSAGSVLANQDRSAVSPPADALPGSPASPEIVAEIQRAVDVAVSRFHAMDMTNLLAQVSDHYRTGSLTKAGIADQLRAVFTIHDQVWARVRVDAVRLVGEHVWVYSTGEVTGRVRYLGGTILVASWERELEVARRENGLWRLYGYQQ